MLIQTLSTKSPGALGMLSKSYLFLAVYCIVMIHISCWLTALEVSVVRVGCSIEYRQKLCTSCIEIRKNELIWSSWVLILTINLIGRNNNTSRLSAMKCHAITDLTATWKQWYSCPEELTCIPGSIYMEYHERLGKWHKSFWRSTLSSMNRDLYCQLWSVWRSY